MVQCFVLMTVTLGVAVRDANIKETIMWLEAQSKTCMKLRSLSFSNFKVPNLHFDVMDVL